MIPRGDGCHAGLMYVSDANIAISTFADGMSTDIHGCAYNLQCAARIESTKSKSHLEKMVNLIFKMYPHLICLVSITGAISGGYASKCLRMSEIMRCVAALNSVVVM